MPKTAPGGDDAPKVEPIKFTGHDTKSSLAFDAAIWDAIRDMAHHLNKVSRSLGQGRVSSTSIISACIQDFRMKPEAKQLALLRKYTNHGN